MTKYIVNEANLKMMGLLRDKSKNIQFEVVHVLKVGFRLSRSEIISYLKVPLFQVFVANFKKATTNWDYSTEK